MKLKWFTSIELTQAFSRFPVASLLAVASTGFALILVENDNDTWLRNMVFISYITAITAIFSRLLADFIDKNNLKWPIEIGLPLAVGVTWYVYLMQEDRLFHWMDAYELPYVMFAWVVITHLFISFIPYFGRTQNQDFWEYNRRLFTLSLLSAGFSLVIFLGLAAAMLALEQLFGLDISSKAYLRLFIILAGIFNTFFLLSQYPPIEQDDKVEAPSKAMSIFTLYILVPIACLYLLILTAYGAKILLEQELPNGWMARLAICFSVITILAWLLNYFLPLFTQNRLSAWFKKFAFIGLIVPVTLLIVSVSTRVAEYGITEPRYILIALISWLILMILLYGFRPSNALKWIPVSLAATIFISIFPSPFNIFNASISSQGKRLQELLSAKKENAYEIRQVIEALDQREQPIKVKKWLSSYELKTDHWSSFEMSYERVNDILDQIGVDKDAPRGTSTNDPFVENLYLYTQTPNTSSSVMGFDSIMPIEAYDGVEYFSSINITMMGTKLLLQLNDQSYEQDINDLIKEHQYVREALPVGKLNVSFTDIEGIEVARLICHSINGENVKESWQIKGVQGILVFGRAQSQR